MSKSIIPINNIQLKSNEVVNGLSRLSDDTENSTKSSEIISQEPINKTEGSNSVVRKNGLSKLSGETENSAKSSQLIIQEPTHKVNGSYSNKIKVLNLILMK